MAQYPKGVIFRGCAWVENGKIPTLTALQGIAADAFCKCYELLQTAVIVPFATSNAPCIYIRITLCRYRAIAASRLITGECCCHWPAFDTKKKRCANNHFLIVGATPYNLF